MSPDSPTVAIFGGGIAGLSAAHELAERGVDVAVYEAKDNLGGKARSVPIAADSGIHGEHGFRFFPAYYRNVTDTMGRIPVGDGRTVRDNLVETDETLIATSRGRGSRASTSTPETVTEWLDALEPNIGGGEVPQREVRFFLRRLLVLLSSCDARREEQWEHTSWWDFIEADDHSQAYRKYLGESTQSLVALDPHRGSARTVGGIYLQLLKGQLDPSSAAERILNAPTNVAWIGPWIDHLEASGVEFHTGTALTGLEYQHGEIAGASVNGGKGRQVAADYYLAAVPVEVLERLVGPDLVRAAPSLVGLERLETAWMSGLQFYLSRDVPIVRGHTVYTDSPWALTSISQRQFWDHGTFDIVARSDGAVEGVLSVIISDWETPGTLYDKPARACSTEEIKTEVWAQMSAHLDRAGQTRLPEDAIVEWFLDPELEATSEGIENHSPLFVNTVGSLDHRPRAGTEIPNLLVAGDYVHTETDLATMESANEAARRAVNAIIDRAGLNAARCHTWGLEEPTVFEPLKRQDRFRYRLGLPHPGTVETSVRQAVRRLAP